MQGHDKLPSQSAKQQARKKFCFVFQDDWVFQDAHIRISIEKSANRNKLLEIDLGRRKSRPQMI